MEPLSNRCFHLPSHPSHKSHSWWPTEYDTAMPHIRREYILRKTNNGTHCWYMGCLATEPEEWTAPADCVLWKDTAFKTTRAMGLCVREGLSLHFYLWKTHLWQTRTYLWLHGLKNTRLYHEEIDRKVCTHTQVYQIKRTKCSTLNNQLSCLSIFPLQISSYH